MPYTPGFGGVVLSRSSRQSVSWGPESLDCLHPRNSQRLALSPSAPLTPPVHEYLCIHMHTVTHKYRTHITHRYCTYILGFRGTFTYIHNIQTSCPVYPVLFGSKLIAIPQEYGRTTRHVLWWAKIVKCHTAGTQNVSDVLTKTLTLPAFEKHKEHMWGTRVPFSDFFSTVETKMSPVVTYSIKLPKFIPSSNFSRKTKCTGG